MKTRFKLIALVAAVAIAALDSSGQVAQAFGNVSVTPTAYLLRRSERMVAKYVGEPDWQNFHARVERALAEPA